MTSFSDYNPNYEERRGRYAPADGHYRLQHNDEAGPDRQNTAVPAEDAAQAPRVQEPNEQGQNKDA